MNAFVKGGGSGKEGYGWRIRRVVREVRFLLDGILDKRCLRRSWLHVGGTSKILYFTIMMNILYTSAGLE